MRHSLTTIMIFLALTLGVTGLTGCGNEGGDQPMQDAADSMEDAAEDVQDAAEEGMEDAKETIEDAGAAIGNQLNQLGDSIKTALAVEDAPAGATPVNAVCPFSGKPVNADANMVVFHDKTYGFCCNDCYKTAKDAPEKLAKAIGGN